MPSFLYLVVILSWFEHPILLRTSGLLYLSNLRVRFSLLQSMKACTTARKAFAVVPPWTRRPACLGNFTAAACWFICLVLPFHLDSVGVLCLGKFLLLSRLLLGGISALFSGDGRYAHGSACLLFSTAVLPFVTAVTVWTRQFFSMTRISCLACAAVLTALRLGWFATTLCGFSVAFRCGHCCGSF